MINFKFTIFTPCYNGANTIKRVFDSVEAQTYTDFEWIIVNDGSKDNSDFVIRDLIDRSPVKNQIRYIMQENMGKHRTWNKVVDLAEGGVFLPADADDSFLPETLEYFNRRLNEVADRFGSIDNFSGINVCVYDPITGKLHGTAYPENGMISDNVELTYRYKIRGEHWGCIRTELLKQYKFPEIKGHFYTENRLWFYLAKLGYKVACYNDCLRAYFYEETSLTHNINSKWDLGRNAMMLHYHLWVIFQLGGRILKYSPSAFLNLWKQTMADMVKCGFSLVNRSQ